MMPTLKQIKSKLERNGFTFNSMIIGSNIRLRDKRLADARDDYRWQTDSELARLDATSLPAITFPQYLSEYTFKLYHPSPTRREFAIETLDGKHIGNCTYYNIDEADGEAELGIMIGDSDYWDKGYGTEATTALLDYIFHKTNLERIHLKTLDWNTRARRCFEKCGFTQYGQSVRDGFSFLLMEIRCKQWQERPTERKT